MNQVRALFVDAVPDEHAVIRVLANRLGSPSLTITSLFDLPIDLIQVDDHDIVLIGDHGSDRSGLSFIEQITRSGSEKPIVYLIDHEDDERATAALLAGASDVVARDTLSSQLLYRSLTFALEHAASNRRMAQQNQRMVALIEAIPDLVLRFDADSELLASYGALTSCDSTLSALTVDDLQSEIGEEERRIVHEGIKSAIGTGELCIVEVTTRSARDLEARISPIADASEVVVLVSDVTTRNAQRRALVETIAAKDVILADVAHELRGPLTSVIGFAQLLTLQGDSLSEGEVHEMLGRILSQANDVQGMVEDLLTAARQDIGKLSVVAVRTAVNAQIAQVMESLADDQAARITVRNGAAICTADPGRVRQICRNLVSNALRYGGPNIDIYTCTSGDIVALEVVDDGVGVAESRRDDLFVRHATDPFNTDSVGLGLALSRDLARMMGGDVVYERRDDRSVFRLTLPAEGANISPIDVHTFDVRGVFLEDDTSLQLQ